MVTGVTVVVDAIVVTGATVVVEGAVTDTPALATVLVPAAFVAVTRQEYLAEDAPVTIVCVDVPVLTPSICQSYAYDEGALK